MNHRLNIAFLLVVSLAGCSLSRDVVIDRKGDSHPWTHLNFRNDPDNFQFAIIGDLTGGYRQGVFEKAVTTLNLLQPEFVMSVGDLVDGLTGEGAERDGETFDQWVGQLEMPFFYVMGDHDVGDNLWEKRLGPSYYHFLYKDVLFLVLNTQDDDQQRLGDEQVAYAEDVLKKYGDVRWTFVFMHKAIWHDVYLKMGVPPRLPKPATLEQWQKIETALGIRPCTVFNGDWHSFTRFTRRGRDHFVLGTTGGVPGWDGQGPDHVEGPARGEFDHIIWVTMTGQGPRVAPLNLHGLYDENIHVGKIDLLRASRCEYSTDGGSSFSAEPVVIKPGETKTVLARCGFMIVTDKRLTDYAGLRLSHRIPAATQVHLTLNGRKIETKFDEQSNCTIATVDPAILRMQHNLLQAEITFRNDTDRDVTALPDMEYESENRPLRLEPIWCNSLAESVEFHEESRM
jgi:hypothetical protein